MKKYFILFAILLTSYFAVNHLTYLNKINKLDNAITKNDINNLEKLFIDPNKNQLENLIKWSENNPDDYNYQIELIKKHSKHYGGSFKG